MLIKIFNDFTTITSVPAVAATAPAVTATGTTRNATLHL